MKIISMIMMVIIVAITVAGCKTTKTTSEMSSLGVVSVTSDESGDVTVSESSEESSKTESNVSEESKTQQNNESKSQSGNNSITQGSTTVPNTPDTKANAPTAADKPSIKNTSNLVEPIASHFDSQANAMRNKVLNSTDNVKTSGKKYYISNNGNDNNNGTTPSSAWNSLSALEKSKHKLKSGDAVLFERGDVFRGRVNAVSGVYYGAYGSGDKPCIYGSAENYAKYQWTNKGKNIWMLEKGITANIGNVVFDHGKAYGAKKSDLKSLEANFDFAVQYSHLYVYLDRNPSSTYSSIEVCTDGRIIYMGGGTNNVTIDNLTLKYTGGHAIQGINGVSGITVKNCEIGFVGGSILEGYGSGTTRYGNGIEFYDGCKDINVTNCWIYQIYDSAITYQGSGKYKVENVKFSNNLLEYCGFGSIEYWLNNKNSNSMANVLFDSNIMRFSGFGFGGHRSHLGSHIHSNGGDNANLATDFRITNNIFDIAFNKLLVITSTADTLPVLSGNTYAQYKDRKLGEYGMNSSSFGSNVADIIKNTWGDATAKVELY